MSRKLMIVMIPFHDYKKWNNEGFRTRDAHLMQHFSSNEAVERILVVNRPTSYAELIAKKGTWKTQNTVKIEYCRGGICLSKMADNVWCIDILCSDILKVAIQKKAWWFTSFNYPRVINAINEAIKYLDMEDNILLLQNPMAIGAAKGVITKHFVFDAIDNWLYHPQMKDKALIKKNYKFVDAHAELVTTVSEALTHTFPTNQNVHWLANGVDRDYFSGAIKTSLDDHITVGYVGKIQDRVDFDLVEDCLKQYPFVEFIFIGPAFSQKEKIKQLDQNYKNITFTGDVHYSKLPEAMKDMDIAIIPHKVDQLTSSMNPLKLYEYLAAGKPVVTTKVAGTDDISQFVFSASRESFVEVLGNIITEVQNNVIKQKDVARSLPHEFSWNKRSEDYIKLLVDL